MDYKILIAEDEEKLREVLSDFLESKGDKPYIAANGREAMELIAEEDFDIVLLDIMMPEMNGREVCRRLREDSDIPIIFMTALSDEEDKLMGYELGADDYVTKPFSMAVLYAKITALIKRRRGNMTTGNMLSLSGITILISSHQVFAGIVPVSLTPKEFAILECLMKNKNMILSREQILIKCWGYDYEGDARAVDTQIRRLREKLGKKAKAIKTIIKTGYMFEAKDE